MMKPQPCTPRATSMVDSPASTGCHAAQITPYITKDGSLIRELLHPSVIPGLGMSLAEATVEAGAKTERHTHSMSDEIYYILDGTGTLYLGNCTKVYSRESYFLIPKHTPHHLEAETHTRILCVCCPGYDHEQTELVG